jgi:hypothetical protein
MPRLADLFLQFKEKDEIFVDGTIDALFSAYAVPIKLKYECPLPSKFGKDLPLWKTATTCFLKIVKEVGPQVGALDSSMASSSSERAFRVLILNHDCRAVGREGGEHMEAGDRRVPRRHLGGLVGPFAGAYIPYCLLLTHGPARPQIAFLSRNKRTKKTLTCP